MARSPFNPFMGQSIKSAAGRTDKGFIAHYIIEAADAAAAAVNAIAPVTTLADGSTTTLTTADIDQPTTPRVLSVTGNAAGAAGDVVITGTDAAGEALVETIVATGANTVAGTKAFASVETIVLPARGAGGDTIAVGATGAFGIPFVLPHDTVVKILNNNVPTTVASSSWSSTVLADNYITPTAALAGNQIDVYLIV